MNDQEGWPNGGGGEQRAWPGLQEGWGGGPPTTL